MPDINIGSKLDAKGFKQAETSLDKLSGNVKGLAKTLGVTFGATQLLAFGKASVKAAAADEKAQKQLALALKNVGLGRDVAASEAFIQKLQSEFGVVDDKLRPAYQQLAVATGDTAQSQKLLQIALDISASTGRDLASVTGAISKAYLGNNTALGKLGVGISKADLKAKSFDEIMNQLSTTFAGSATQSANTFQGSMDKLAVASANVQEIIGKGLIDAFKMLGDDDSVDNLAVQMESVALYIADSIRGIGVLVGYIQSASDAAAKIPFLSKITDALLKLSPLFGGLAGLNALAPDAAGTADSAQALAHLAELESRYANITLKAETKLTAEQLKQLKAKQLKLAIDKANLALGKGSNVFDIEKIQLAAAEKNAAEQLGKVTSQAQLLQITNDLARLNVKQSILALEDAIAGKDIKAIEAGTAKLNKDLAILGVLTGQEIKLRDIESILKDIVPKDLINLANLDAALAKLKAIGAVTVTPTSTNTPTTTSRKTLLTAEDYNAMLMLGRTVPVVPDSSGNIGYSGSAGAYASSGFPGATKNGGVTVVVNAGTVANPEELTTMIQNAVISLNKRGDATTYAGSL